MQEGFEGDAMGYGGAVRGMKWGCKEDGRGEIYDERVNDNKNIMTYLMIDTQPIFEMIWKLKFNLSKNPRNWEGFRYNSMEQV